MVEDWVDAGGDVVGDARDVMEDVEELDHRWVGGVPVQGHQPLRLVWREAQEEGDHNCHCEGEGVVRRGGRGEEERGGEDGR